MTKILPSEPAPAPPKGFRPHMPLKVQLEAALRALGLTPQTVDFDHCPPLQMRVWVPEKNDTDPPANDARFIVPRQREAHRAKTSGGQIKARAQGDVTEIAKTKRMSSSQEEFRRRILAKDTHELGCTAKRKTKWLSRPMRPRKAKP